MSGKLEFCKMHGIGNDFVMVDNRANFGYNWVALAQKLCDRTRGVGADGLITLETPAAGLTMRMWNPDGSESEMCGNGIRCFAIFAQRLGIDTSVPLQVHTGAGVLVCKIEQMDRVAVCMGTAKVLSLTRSGITSEFVKQPIDRGFVGTAISMGNPHLVIFVEDLSQIDIQLLGPELAASKLFPAGVNVHFAKTHSANQIEMITWERGAGATLACGTGACAVTVAGIRENLCSREVIVQLPGGQLDISVDKNWSVTKTGTAEPVFVGSVSI